MAAPFLLELNTARYATVRVLFDANDKATIPAVMYLLIFFLRTTVSFWFGSNGPLQKI